MLFKTTLTSLTFILLTSACNESSDTSIRQTEMVGTREKSHFSDHLKTIDEPPLNKFTEPIVYRFWLYYCYRIKVLTITRNENGKSLAHYCTLSGGTEPLHVSKTWTRELTPEKAAQAFALIKKRGFWESTESVKIPAGDRSTGGALFEIEAKDKTKQKIAFCDREFDRDYTSTYENLCKDMFVFVSEP